jgi:hypothetical protein
MISGYFSMASFLVLSHTPYNSKPGCTCKNGAWKSFPLMPKERIAVLIGVISCF